MPPVGVKYRITVDHPPFVATVMLAVMLTRLQVISVVVALRPLRSRVARCREQALPLVKKESDLARKIL